MRALARAGVVPLAVLGWAMPWPMSGAMPLGVLVVSVSAPGADLVGTLLLAQWGLLALSLILVDEIDNAYGDVYSGAVSLAQPAAAGFHFAPGVWRWRPCVPCWRCCCPCTTWKPFLLLLSSVFVPLYGVIWGGWVFAAGSGQRSESVRVDYGAAAIWLAGIAPVHYLVQQAPAMGCQLADTAVHRPAGSCHAPSAKAVQPALKLVSNRLQTAFKPASNQLQTPGKRRRSSMGCGAKPWFSGPLPWPVLTCAPCSKASRIKPACQLHGLHPAAAAKPTALQSRWTGCSRAVRVLGVWMRASRIHRFARGQGPASPPPPRQPSARL